MNRKRLFIAIFLMAAVLRVGYIVYTGNNLKYPDEKNYHKIAVKLAEGKIQENTFSNREPLYPIVISLFYKLFGVRPVFVKIFQGILSLVSLIFIFEIGKVLFNIKVGFIALLISAVYPFFIFYNAYLLRESVLVFWSVLILLFSMKTVKYNSKYFYWISLFCGFAVLTKLIFLFYWLCFLLISLILKKLRIKTVVFGIVLFFVTLLPWLYFNYLNTGEIFLTRGQMFNLYAPLIVPPEIIGTPEENKFLKSHAVFSKGVKLPLEKQDIYFRSELVKEMKARPFNFIKKTLWRFVKLWRFFPYRGKNYTHSWLLLFFLSIFSYGIIFFLAAYGGIKLLRRLGEIYFFYLFVFSFSVIYSLSWSQIRYRLPLMPVLIIFAAYTLSLLIWKQNEQD